MKISVCTWVSCKDRFSEYIITRLKNDKERFNLDTLFIEECLCTWNCKTGPNIKVDGDIRPYMNPAKASVAAMNNWAWSWKKKKKKKKKKNKDQDNINTENKQEGNNNKK